MITHTGSCHCGAIRIGARAPANLAVHECSCSMCERTVFPHPIVPADRCLDRRTINSLQVLSFDGRNWEGNADSLAHLSRHDPEQ